MQANLESDIRLPMPKIPKMLYLNVETTEKLAERSADLGVSQSALADLLIRGGLATVSKARLQEWAKTLVEPAPTIRVKPKASEVAVLLLGLTTDWRSFQDIRKATNQGEAVLWRALKALEARGEAEMQPVTSYVNPVTGRPVQSFWRRVGSSEPKP